MDYIENIFIGDSISFGYGDNEFLGYVNRFRFYESTLNNIYGITFNLSIPGDDSYDILYRIEHDIETRLRDVNKLNIILQFGINDVENLTYDNNINDFNNNLINIINICKKYTNNIYFLELIKPDYNIRNSFLNDNYIKINNLIKDYCLNNNIKFIECSNLIENDLIDGLHPNKEGHDKLAKLVLKNVYNLK